MVNKYTEKILKELAKKYPGKTRLELFEIRKKILKRKKVIEFLKRQKEKMTEKEDPSGKKKSEEVIKKVLEKVKKKEIDESLQFVKFHYDNAKNDKNPQVKVLDFKYKGQPGQKTYGKRKDLLGWNVNYFSNKKYAKKAIDDIDSFARMIGANSGKEKYERLKYFFPEQAKLIRRYIQKHIKNLKHKPGKFFWHKIDVDNLIKFDKESY